VALIYEKLFDDETGMRIVTKPNESLRKETVHIILRVQTGPGTVKVVSFELVDKDKNECLEDEFFDALLQHKIKEVGRQCKKCERYFLPTSPNHQMCDKC
jgi:hypothetical protein